MAAAAQEVAALTRPLRKAHLAVWMLLPLLLAAVLTLSLRARRPTTPVNRGLHWESLR